MTRPAQSAAVPASALQDVAQPAEQKLMGEVGEAGGRDTLAALEAAVRELKAMAVAPLLKRSIQALNREDFVTGGKVALQALERDERSGVAWYLLGIARERAGDFQSSVQAYEAALKLLPDHAEVANDLGRLAYRMGMHDQAEKLFRHFIAHAPDKPDGVNNLASVLKDSDRQDEAIEVLKGAIPLFPQAAMLWNTLGTLLLDIGDVANAVVFLNEAVRLDPKFGKARYNLSQALIVSGDPHAAMDACDRALTTKLTADDRANMRFARSTYYLAMGKLGEGWDAYEERFAPQFPDITRFLIDAPRWKPGMDIRGKSFLVCAEQGLGDEVLFANVMREVIERVGPEGHVMLAVERRLVDLFRRSYPTVEVMGHKTYVLAARPGRVIPKLDESRVELWTPIASLLREWRRNASDFPAEGGYLTPDPKRVKHWEKALASAPGGLKVGLLWKSAVSKGHRNKLFSPFQQWAPVLKTPGAVFVNLQYGDCAAEIAQAKAEFGIDIWQPPGIDLKEDLDDLAALCMAMDLVIGFSNATFNIGAACGVPSWLISTPGAWPRLGEEDRYLWYPQARVFAPTALGAWDEVMTRIADELDALAKA